MGKRTGFTLAELVAVLVVVGVTVLAFLGCRNGEEQGDRAGRCHRGGPARAITRRFLGGVWPRELSRRVYCQANLKGIGTALMLYTAVNDDVWPFIRNAGRMDYEHPMATTAASPYGLGGGEQKLHVAANLNLLVYDDHVGYKMFRCPSEGDATMMRDEKAERYGFGEDANGDGKAETVYLDYGYHNGYRHTKDTPTPDAPNPASLRASNNPALVILADQPPNTKYPDTLRGSPWNHGAAGLNYLRAGGDAGWHPGAGTGAGEDEDRIYQSDAGGDGTPDSDGDSCLISPYAGQPRKE